MNIMEQHENLVTISRKEYDSLLEDSAWLNCLQNAGVNNWCGWDYALELYQEQYGDEE